MIVKAVRDCYINGRYFKGGENYLLPSVPKMKMKKDGKVKLVDCDKFEIVDKNDTRMTAAQKREADLKAKLREEIMAEMEEKKKKNTPEVKSFKQATEETKKPGAKGAGAKKE